MVAAYLGIKTRYKDPDELPDAKAETERWLKMEQECSEQPLDGLFGDLGRAVKIQRAAGARREMEEK